jgi:endoglucanase
MKTFVILLSVITLLSACKTAETVSEPSDLIRLNQVGYYPNSTKEFVVVGMSKGKFEVVDELDNTVLSGELTPQGNWALSGETVALGDFSKLQAPGKYAVVVDGKLYSHPFEVNTSIYNAPLNAAVKSYYYQRASIAIETQFGGTYARAAGHPDDQVSYHPSSGKSTGTRNSPGGWYDAGDYGKYVVNAAFSVGQMLNLLEQYPSAVPDGALNIPESGNDKSDLLDELKYELDWLMTMQDEDGGVFFKLTAKTFSAFIMPEAYDLERFIIGKATASSLDFAAVMAQASRVYMDTDPNWSEEALAASKQAYDWASKNPEIYFKNPVDVVTGEYGDTTLTDEFYWASTELYLSTKEDYYLQYLLDNEEPIEHQLTNSWMFFVRNNAFHSLLEHLESIDPALATRTKNGQIKLANDILAKIDKNPYHIGLDIYEWGSNSDMLNQALILCHAHGLTGDDKYLQGVEQTVDYIFCKNALGYSFLTGFGAQQGMFPHHRPSGADGIAIPVPGFILGGPNGDKQDAEHVMYRYEEPARSFEDVEASFASNEVCINWNAPAIYVLGYLEQVR